MMSYFKNIETNGYYIKIEHRYSSHRRSMMDTYLWLRRLVKNRAFPFEA